MKKVLVLWVEEKARSGNQVQKTAERQKQPEEELFSNEPCHNPLSLEVEDAVEGDDKATHGCVAGAEAADEVNCHAISVEIFCCVSASC